MQQTLASHNGLRLDPSSDDGKLPILAKLTANNCKLHYVVNSREVIDYDLSDIDPNTIKVWTVTAGPGTGVSSVDFDARNFDKSVRYTNPSDPKADYSADNGAFDLDAPEHAESFAKALRHAVELCGGKSSTF